MSATERTLTQRELNRALLARQLLLERDDTTIPRVLERMGGLQAQYAPSMYIGLWSRLARFERDDLTRALERKTVVQGTLMRSTIHLVSARDYWPFAVAIRHARREWWLRSHKGGPSAREMADAAKRLRRQLRNGPLRRTEVDKLVGAGAVGVGGVGMWLDLVRVPPSGTWERRRADLYGAAEDWLGASSVTAEAAREHLVRRYLGGFGPASRNDIADWAGLPLKEVASVLNGMRVRRFRDEADTELVDLPRAPLPAPDTPRRCGFCPYGTQPCWRTPGAPASSPKSTSEGLQHQDPAVRADVPRRRVGGGNVGLRGRSDPAGAVRAPRRRSASPTGRGSRGARRAPRVNCRYVHGPWRPATTSLRRSLKHSGNEETRACRGGDRVHRRCRLLLR